MAQSGSAPYAIKFDVAKEVFVCDQTFAALVVDDKAISLRSDRPIASDEVETRVQFADGLYSIKAHATSVFSDHTVLFAFPGSCKPVEELYCAIQQTVEVDDGDDDDDDLDDDDVDPITLTPAHELYAPLHAAFEEYNYTFFENALPDDVMITIQAKGRSHGYFAPERFRSTRGNYTVDVIALNPQHFLERDVAKTLSTIAHEMVHCWQHRLGKPSRNGYHNKEWAAKMIEIGLMPSDTGEPGGKTTGQKMSHYIIEGGRFERLTNSMLEYIAVPWGEIEIEKPKATRSVYTCLACGLTMPGKRNVMSLGCDCTGSWTRMSESVR